MSRINTNTKIIGSNKEGAVLPIMTNSIADLKLSIHKLIQLITNSNITIEGDFVMAVTFQQQGIFTF